MRASGPDAPPLKYSAPPGLPEMGELLRRIVALPALALLPNRSVAPSALATRAPSTVILAFAAVEELAKVAEAPVAPVVPPIKWIVALPAVLVGGPSGFPAKKRELLDPIVMFELAAVDLL